MHENVRGYVEDRRPASNIDRYIVSLIVFDIILIENIQAIPWYSTIKTGSTDLQ